MGGVASERGIMIYAKRVGLDRLLWHGAALSLYQNLMRRRSFGSVDTTFLSNGLLHTLLVEHVGSGFGLVVEAIGNCIFCDYNDFLNLNGNRSVFKFNCAPTLFIYNIRE